MSFKRYITESQRRSEFAVTGDIFTAEINEELAVEMPVMYHNHELVILEADEFALDVMEHCGCQYVDDEKEIDEAEYKGREVKLGKPMSGDVKKYKVYVKDPKTGNVKKVNFGDPNMQIRRDNPEARKNFRARHNCADKKDRTKAGYWSCRMWSKKPVSKILKGK